MRTFLAFIKWILANIGQGILGFHKGFKRDLSREPGVAIVAWFFISLLSSLAMLIILGGIQYLGVINIPVQVWFAYILGCVFYLLYTGTVVMYNAFKAERAELFNTIKQGR